MLKIVMLLCIILVAMDAIFLDGELLEVVLSQELHIPFFIKVALLVIAVLSVGLLVHAVIWEYVIKEPMEVIKTPLQIIRDKELEEAEAYELQRREDLLRELERREKEKEEKAEQAEQEKKEAEEKKRLEELEAEVPPPEDPLKVEFGAGRRPVRPVEEKKKETQQPQRDPTKIDWNYRKSAEGRDDEAKKDDGPQRDPTQVSYTARKEATKKE